MSGCNPATTCSQCLRALRKTASQRVPSHQISRAFTASATHRRSHNIPSFDASSPELTSVLGTIRTRIFLPSRLKYDQKKLVFKNEHRSMLLNEPFYIEIGDEQFQLLPLNQTKDIPDSWKSLSSALKLMGSDTQDWNNFLGLLEGFKQAKRSFRPWQWAMIVRVAGEADKAHLVLEAARSAGRTGLVLQDLAIVREVMWAMRNKAVLQDWEDSAVQKAQRYAEQIAASLDHDVHCGGKRQMTRDDDPRYQPDIIAVLLELTAAHAKVGGDADKVRVYAERLIPNLERIESTLTVNDTNSAVRNADEQLMRGVPIVRALELASEVLGGGMPLKQRAAEAASDLRTRLSKAASVVSESLQDANAATNRKRRGLEWFEAIN